MGYRIYAGMGGGFGGANYVGWLETDDREEAESYAREIAIEEYQSYEGCHGIMSWDDCRKDLIESFGEEPSEEDVDTHYREEIESWTSWYVKPTTGPDDIDDEE